jgi:hypothetical protein
LNPDLKAIAIDGSPQNIIKVCIRPAPDNIRGN